MIVMPDEITTKIFLHLQNISYCEGHIDSITNVLQLLKDYMKVMNKDTLTLEEITKELNVLLELNKKELMDENNKYNMLSNEKEYKQ